MSRNNRINDGGPAFPLNTPTWHEQINCDGYTGIDFTMGLSIRDYFAAKAMQGFAADPKADWVDGAAGMSRAAYLWADAMLAQRDKQ